MQFPQYLVFSHDVLHIDADLIVLFRQFVEVIVGDGCLIGDVLGVYK